MSARDAVPSSQAAGDHDRACRTGGGSGRNAADVGDATVSPMEAMHGCRRTQRIEYVIEQALVGHEQLTAQCGERPEQFAILGQFGLTAQARLHVTLGINR